MNPLDLDVNGSERAHKVISNTTVFYHIPNIKWVVLEDESATVNPFSVYNFHYKVRIPYDKAPSNTSIGYILRINIKRQLVNVTGMNIGIEYDYKLFIIFTGKKIVESSINGYYFIPLPFILAGVFLFFHKRKKLGIVKTKKKEKTIKRRNIDKPLEKTVFDKPVVSVKPVDNDLVDLHKHIDDILSKSHTHRGEDW